MRPGSTHIMIDWSIVRSKQPAKARPEKRATPRATTTRRVAARSPTRAHWGVAIAANSKTPRESPTRHRASSHNRHCTSLTTPRMRRPPPPSPNGVARRRKKFGGTATPRAASTACKKKHTPTSVDPWRIRHVHRLAFHHRTWKLKVHLLLAWSWRLQRGASASVLLLQIM